MLLKDMLFTNGSSVCMGWRPIAPNSSIAHAAQSHELQWCQQCARVEQQAVPHIHTAVTTANRLL
jgi:hypothetical protein